MSTNMNPMSLIAAMRQSGNPQEFICNFIEERMGSNPFFANLIALAKTGRGNEIEAIARNMMKEQGKDFDKEFNSFRKNLGL